ncbi:MAG TPA: POTRA domain-containing protein, partial [Bradyrhizobium sp.]|nr:POTRA domain-containing protein [Bradyrhizobium sp.]
MRLMVFPSFTLCHPWNYGRSVSRAGAGRHRAAAPFAFASLVLIISAIVSSVPASAQQASQPGFDPRQTEKRFDASQSEQTPATRSALQMPRLSRPEARADSKPLVKLRQVSVTGALTMPADQLITAYQPYLGKKVSQADLVAIAGAISDLYRAAGFHLSRAIVPPQDIRDGHLRLQVIEGSITEVALKGEDVERFGLRPVLDPVVAEQPSRLATLERQLLLISGRPGVRIADTALEEIGGATGRFRLVVYLKTWRVYTSFGLDNLGSSTVGPWQTYATGAFNSYLLPGD